jgi:hypothetical protein
MPSAFLTGTVTVGSKPCPGAVVHIAKVPTSSLDGSFMAVVHRTGTYTIIARADGCLPTVVKATVAALDGKAQVVNVKLKAC